MAHNCTNCGCSNISCGCGDSFLTTPPPCPTPVDCPEAQPCSEVFDAACVVYTGPDLQCGLDDVVLTNTPLNLALEDIIGYFCTQPESDITIVEAGDNVTVDVDTVGNTTTYTVNAVIPCPMDVTIIDSVVVPRGYFADVTGGTPPYTYTWSFADRLALAIFTTPNSLPDIGVGNNNIYNCKYDTGGNIDGGTISLFKVVVTDANGCIAKDTYLYIEVDCGA